MSDLPTLAEAASSKKPTFFGVALSDGLVIALSTGAAYLIAYSFEAGRMYFYQLPYFFIDVSVASVLRALIVTTLVTFFLGRVVYTYLEMSVSDHPIAKRVGVLLIVALSIAIFYRVSPDRLREYVWFALALLFAYQFGFPILSQKGTSYWEKLKKHDAKTRSVALEHPEKIKKGEGDFFDQLERVSGVNVLVWAFLLMIMAGIAYRAGFSMAAGEEDYLVGRSSVEPIKIIFVQKISDSVFIGVAVKNRQLTKEVVVVNPQDIQSVWKLEYQTIGPLRRAE